MSELRSTIEALRSESLPELPDGRIEEDFAELHRAAEQLEVERLRRLAEIDRRRPFKRDGFLSTAAWLASAFKVSWGAAKEQVRLARSLEQMPATREALDAGDLSLSSARVLAAARDADPEAFAGSEAVLVEAARLHTTQDLRRVAAYWRDAVDERGMRSGEDRIRARRRLHASVSFLGMVRLDGDLDPETGETLLTALSAVLDAEARSGGNDERTPAQRRADALGEICRKWLDRSGRPTVGGERPHVTVTIEAASLQVGGAPTVQTECALVPTVDAARSTEVGSELDHIGPVSSSVARRLACDASVMRVVMAGWSEPLDVGRRTPVVPPAIRRAVIARDRRCRFPGCDRPHAWCDAHHVVHWADGGPTAVTNLVLLCRRHHRSVHEGGGFRLRLEDGRPVFRRPDGSVLEDRAPP